MALILAYLLFTSVSIEKAHCLGDVA